VLADTVLADTVLADTVLADTVLADTVLADTVLPGTTSVGAPASSAATVSAGEACACRASDLWPGFRSTAATGSPRSATSSWPVTKAVTVWPAPLVQPRNTMRRGPASGSRARSWSSVS